MKPTLFLLAAGMGSRYGGLKQLVTIWLQASLPVCICRTAAKVIS